MSVGQTSLDADERTVLMAEYGTLRQEILKRIELRQQLVSMTLTLAAVFLGVGLGTGTIALIYPVLAALLALAWRQNDFRTRRAAEYIREHHEKRLKGLGWETYCQEQRRDWRHVVMAHGGVFLVTQMLAVLVGIFSYDASAPQMILLAVDALSVIYVIWLFWRSR
ncbi:MAG: hypothetical protein IT320_09430 [Anaerolineae bacterium]|nr:hypothetical protein [Anaerolineae bacterium]